MHTHPIERFPLSLQILFSADLFRFCGGSQFVRYFLQCYVHIFIKSLLCFTASVCWAALRTVRLGQYLWLRVTFIYIQFFFGLRSYRCAPYGSPSHHIVLAFIVFFSLLPSSKHQTSNASTRTTHGQIQNFIGICLCVCTMCVHLLELSVFVYSISGHIISITVPHTSPLRNWIACVLLRLILLLF